MLGRAVLRSLSFRGRAGRGEFLVCIATITAAVVAAHVLYATATPRSWAYSLALLIFLLLALLVAWFAVCRRLHDLDVSAIVAAIPILGLATGLQALRGIYGAAVGAMAEDGALVAGVLLLGLWPGDRGENRFDQLPASRRPPPSDEEIDRVHELIRNLARPMLRLEPAERPGLSKLGGAPEMPPELAWPVGPDGPLAFLAQIDLAEARAAGGPDWLPATGMLFVFNDLERYGFPDHVRVLFARSRDGVARPPPAPLREEYDFGERRVRFQPAASAPSLDWLDLDPRLGRGLDDLNEEFEPDHRIGGYPDELQPGSLAIEAEQMARRYDRLGDAGAARAAAAAAPESTPWRLLLQIDSDDELGMMWGDTGRLYVLIREEDARRGDFTRTVSVMQCY